MKIALCNEILQPLPFTRQCELAAALGYDGLEVAPFTLASDPMALKDADASSLRMTANDEGLEITGLHWLLVAPSGLSIVSDDAAIRERTVAVMKRLIELCALLGGKYLVHGSPMQRNVPEGSTHEQATERAMKCLEQAAAHAQSCGVTYCLEPLAETTWINTVAEAVEIVKAIGSPALRTMVDCSAAAQTEHEPVHELMARWTPTGHIAHVQVNDPNRCGPGQGELKFEPIIRTLLAMQKAGHYNGVVAVEAFDYIPDGPGSAARAIGYLRGVIEAVQATTE